MLLWIGAILCFVTYIIKVSSVEEPDMDDVSCEKHPCHSCRLEIYQHYKFCLMYTTDMPRIALNISVTNCPFTLSVNFTLTSGKKYRQWRSYP